MLGVLRHISHADFDTVFAVRNVILLLNEIIKHTVAHPVKERV